MFSRSNVFSSTVKVVFFDLLSHIQQLQRQFFILHKNLYKFSYKIVESSRIIKYIREESFQYKYTSQQIPSINNKMSQNKTLSKDFKTSVVGVDLGSLYTKIAGVDNGAVDIITNEANLRQTPTVIGFGNKERLIGQAGNVKLKSNYANTIVSPNRYLGFKQSDYIITQNAFALCASRSMDKTQYFKVDCQGKEQKLLPEQLTAAFFNKISQIVQINKIDNKNLVVSVPNYLTQSQRQAILDSIQIAKESSQLSYGVNLINESTAVGLDYGFYKKNEFSQKEEQAKNVMFLDLGYSKLSLYVIKFTKNYQKMIYQKHLRHFGCRQLDELMLQYYTSMFESNHLQMQTSIKESKRATLKLLENIQKQRRVLSGNSQYDFNIECLLEDNDLSYSMKKSQFEIIIAQAIHHLRMFLEEVKHDIKDNKIQLSSIEMLGGGSRIPLVIRTINQTFGMEASRTLNSSESIARGAALYSAMNSGIFRVQNYHAVELCPHKISCKWKGQNEQIQNQSNVEVLLNQGQYLLTKKVAELTIKANQSQIFQCYYPQITQGLNKKICSFRLNLPKTEQYLQRKVHLCIQFNSNGLLDKITASQMKDKQMLPLTISHLQFQMNISSTLLKEFIKKEEEWLLKDQEIIQYYESKNKFESAFFSIKEKLRSSINSQDKQFINPEIYNKFLEFLEQVENSFQEVENFQEKIKEMKEKLDKYYKEIQDNKMKYRTTEAELNRLVQFINDVVSGRIRNVKFYPGEQVDKIKKWIKEKLQEQEKRPKFLQPATTKEQIRQVFEDLKLKIQECQQQALIRQRQQPQHQQQHYQNSHFDSPYGKGRRGRNNASNNSGFFSGFSRFF